MTLTLRVLSAEGWVTPAGDVPLTAGQVDATFLDLYDRAKGVRSNVLDAYYPVGSAKVVPSTEDTSEFYLPLAGGTYNDTDYPELAQHYTSTAGQFTVQDLTGTEPGSGFVWVIRAK